VKTIYYRSEKDQSLTTLSKPTDGCWINIEEATKHDLEEVVKLTGLDYIDIDDSLDLYELPRLEKHKDATLLFVRNPAVENEAQHTEILTILVTSKYLITISPGQNSTLSYLLHYAQQKLYTHKPTKLLITILLNIAQQFTYEIKTLRTDVRRYRGNISDIDTPDFLILSKSEERLNYFLSALVADVNVVEALLTTKKIYFHEDDKDLLDDLLITIKQSADICRTSVANIRSTRDSYQLIFTNNLNKTIKLLTSLTIILTIPTLISSIFGMNVRLPFSETSSFAFYEILLLILLAAVSVLLIFNWKRWL
jgi:magnesium transporter